MEYYRDIKFSPPDLDDNEVEEVAKVLKSGWITTGPKTKEFEKKISEYIGVPRTVCLNSATAAMELSLRFLGIGSGDEVITTAYTYTASAAVIHHVGAKIVLVDTYQDTFEINYDQLQSAITEKTKAIIPVDIAGVMCDYSRIYDIINKKKNLFKANNDKQSCINRVVVIADAAHSFGAQRNNVISGLAADITCFSFHAVKNLTTAEGGAVVWQRGFGLSNDDIYREFMLLSLHGQSKDALAKSSKGAWEYDIIYPAYKCNMTDVLAAIGVVQLKKYDNLIRKRYKLLDIYENTLDKNRIQVIKHRCKHYLSSAHLMLVNIMGIDEEMRNDIIIKMAQLGIATNVHYKPLPMFTAYKNLGFAIEDYPNSYKKYRNEITLPLHTLMSEDDVFYVSTALNKIVSNLSVKE